MVGTTVVEVVFVEEDAVEVVVVGASVVGAYVVTAVGDGVGVEITIHSIDIFNENYDSIIRCKRKVRLLDT